MSNEIRVRFAPSPTGQVHIGNIRAAIFNWLFARHESGKFLLRIEDTDRERSTPEAIEGLLESMQWLGLDYDEEPLYQSTRADTHLAAAQKLIDGGNAYRFAKGEGGEATLFRIPWNSSELPFVRAVGEQSVQIHPDETVVIGPAGMKYALVSKKGKPFVQEACLAGFRELEIISSDGDVLFNIESEIESILGGDTKVIEGGTCMRYMRHEVFFQDEVKGELSKPLDSMRDLVIVRSNGAPVFHLANVCDDMHQGVTHIIRGDDHVENTYRHLFLFHGLDYAPPRYAHLPMIVNKQGKPYSKRDGDAYVGDFRTKGFLADALFNYLTLLGWSPGDDREKMTREELIGAFSLDRVRSSASQMDPMKLTNLNGQYLADMPFDEFCAETRRALAGVDWYETADDAYFLEVAKLLQTRSKLFVDAIGWKYLFDDDVEYNEKLSRKNFGKEGAREAFELLATNLSEIEFTEEAIEAAIHKTTDARELRQGKFNLPIRVAVTGTNIGAGLYETMVLLGKERVLARIRKVIDEFCNK